MRRATTDADRPPGAGREPRVLLTSVCRPLGPRHGDAPSVGYELLFGQVTRAQGEFSPRATHIHFSLEYLAENIDAPTTVLQYPSRRELARELKRGYDVVGVSFVVPTFHRLKEVVALVRRHCPAATIVLGGYGTVLPDETLRPWGDHICREEGVGFLRRVLGEPPRAMPYRHPFSVSRLRLFSLEASRTGMVFAGLGCPGGCDFCSTSHFFGRRHLKLLATGRDIHRVVARYIDHDPRMSIVVLDEDFLLNRRRAMEFRDAVREDGRPLSLFVFASIRALSQYRVEEIVEMGIDGVWIGYEGARAGFAKQSGRPVEELFADLRAHGIAVLASMILGLPYQTREVVEQELDGLLALEPALCQFLIVSPVPGTPWHDQVVAEGRLRPDIAHDPESRYRQSCGFTALVQHPAMTGAEIEAAQERCFAEDFRRLGPSIYRTAQTWLLGHERLKAAAEPMLRRKAEHFAWALRRSYPIFLAGRVFAPTPAVRRRIAELEGRLHRCLGAPSLRERAAALAAVAMAGWTRLTLALGLFQHPALQRHTWRMPGERRPPRAWRRLVDPGGAGPGIDVELRRERVVWVRVSGPLPLAAAERLAADLTAALRRGRERLVLDLEKVRAFEEEAARCLAEALASHRARICVLRLPAAAGSALTELLPLHP